METEHKTAIDKFSKQLNKIFNLFPHIKELINFESFCRKVGFGTEMIQRLFNRESVGFKGEIYSHEYHRKFSTSHSVAKIEPDPKQSQKFRLNINGLEIYDWFRQKQKEFLHSIGIKPTGKTKWRNEIIVLFHCLLKKKQGAMNNHSLFFVPLLNS